jgi:foldase protein PrsA
MRTRILSSLVAVAIIAAAAGTTGYFVGAQETRSAERTLKVNQVARIGDSVITAEEFIERLIEIERPLMPDRRNAGTALDLLVAERLLDLESERLDATPKAREIGDEMQALEGTWRAEMERENQDRIREQQRRGLPERPLSWEEFINQKTGMSSREFSAWLRTVAARNIRMRLVVGYWEETSERAEAWGIRTDTRDQANALRERFLKGESFSTLARNSTEFRSRDFGGRIGMVWRGDGRLDSEVDKAFWDLKDDEITQPVQTPHGWWITLRKSTILANEAPFYEMRELLLGKSNVDANRFRAWRNALAAGDRYVYERRMPGLDVGADQP